MPPTEPAAVNPDLRAVHTQLIALARSLDEAVGQARTSAEVNAILDEIVEVNARVTNVGRRLFTRQTEAIQEAAQAVMDSTAEAEDAIGELEDVQGFIEGITHFLGVVDKLVDTAKLVL
jgi:hypothetical protein